jgi:dephospho-CoA kinase
MAAFIVAVTGGIASGKSAVCALFARAGVPVADADLIAHALVAPGTPALAEIVAAFGAQALAADGSLDRAALRARVFADAQARARLEAITHPRIRAELSRQCAQAAADYAIAAIPLLAEAGTDPRAHYPWLRRILVVDAPPRLQAARLQSRDGIDAALAARMLAAQATRQQRLALASDVLVNDDGLDFLEAPVRRLDARYRALAREKQVRGS